MDFFDSISVVFHAWELICLSPFSLKHHQKNLNPRNSHRIYSLTVISMQILMIICSGIFLNHIVHPEILQVVKILDVTTVFLVQMTTLIVFIESYKKRFVQMNFLRQINTIDFILEYKIGIRPDYAKGKRTTIKLLCRWFILSISIFIVNFVLMYHLYAIAYRWWTVIFASFLIYSLQYHQITTYVDIISQRFNLITQCLNEQTHQEISWMNIHVDLIKTRKKVRTISQMYKTGDIHEKLADLKRICHLLSSANQSINEMFKWSIPLIIVNDFLQTIINSYWVLRILFSTDSIDRLVAPLLWTLLNLNHFISLASVCHSATVQVNFAFLDLLFC